MGSKPLILKINVGALWPVLCIGGGALPIGFAATNVVGACGYLGVVSPPLACFASVVDTGYSA